LTRNPGSHRSGPSMAEKKVKDLFEICKASSCDPEMQAQIALRRWYANDDSLTLGLVDIRKPGVTDGSRGVLGPTGAEWGWVAWAIAIIGFILVIVTLIGCFRMQPRRRKDRDLGFGEELHPLQHGTHSFQDAPPTQHAGVQMWPQPHMMQSGHANMYYQNNFPYVQQPQSQQQQPQGSQVFDDSLVQQAMLLQSQLATAGTQAVQQMQMDALEGLRSGMIVAGGGPGLQTNQLGMPQMGMGTTPLQQTQQMVQPQQDRASSFFAQMPDQQQSMPYGQGHVGPTQDFHGFGIAGPHGYPSPAATSQSMFHGH